MEKTESAFSYVLALFLLMFTTIVDNASGIMTFGGLVLLGLRLYVDGKKAQQVYKESRRDRKGG